MFRRRILLAAVAFLALCSAVLFGRNLYSDAGLTAAGNAPTVPTATVTVTLKPSPTPVAPTSPAPVKPAASPTIREAPARLP
jgi:hypothetical protein